MHYGNLWRRQRRTFHEKFREGQTPQFHPLELNKVVELLKNLLESPDDFRAHIRQWVEPPFWDVFVFRFIPFSFPTSMTMYLTYGHTVAPTHDPLVSLVDGAILALTETFLPGSYLVNVFPIRKCTLVFMCRLYYGLPVRHIPGWFPGAGFKRLAQRCREQVDEMINLPFQSAKNEVVRLQFIPIVTIGRPVPIPDCRYCHSILDIWTFGKEQRTRWWTGRWRNH